MPEGTELLTRAFQLQKVETKKQIGTNNDWFSRRALQTPPRLRISRTGAGIEPEIAPEFGDIRTDRLRPANSCRGAKKSLLAWAFVSLGRSDSNLASRSGWRNQRVAPGM